MKYQKYKKYYRRYFRSYIHRPYVKLKRKLYRASPNGKLADQRGKQKYRYKNGGALKDAIWKKKNADKVWAYKSNYKHRRREWEKTGKGLTKEEWKALCKKYNYRCYICGKRKKLEQDHVKPLSKGGRHIKRNIKPICRQCNCRKRNKLNEPKYHLPRRSAGSPKNISRRIH